MSEVKRNVWTEVLPGRFNPHEHHPIPGGVAAAKGVILSGEFEHGSAIAAPVSQIEVDVMTMSENDRCCQSVIGPDRHWHA